MDLLVLTKDEDIYDLIALELSGRFSSCVRKEAYDGQTYSLIVCDLDTCVSPIGYGGRVLCFSRKMQNTDCDFILRPFDIKSFVCRCEDDKSVCVIDEKRGTVSVFGNTVKLTERELRLFCTLLSAKGEYVSKRELLKRAFDGASDEGLLTVYIHYLRKKIEKGDRRLIFSSKGKGYRMKTKEEVC